MIRKRYNDYPTFIKNTFGQRVQKIAINIGFTCPNRDGTKGVGGCTYCNNNAFSPDYCTPNKSITQQLDEGMAFFEKRYPSQKYLAYFQSYTNTYGDLQLIKAMYSEALAHPKIIGLVVGTRPDCINEEVLDYLEEMAKKYFVSLELGIESTMNKTLEKVNRCHTFEETKKAYQLAQNRGLHLGAHLIIGLPGESREEMLNHAKTVSKLPIHSLKIHQLQVIKHTQMAKDYEGYPFEFELFGIDEYLDFLVKFVANLRPNIIIERFASQSPHKLLIAPRWNGLKNFEIVDKLDRLLEEKGVTQGINYKF